MSNINESVKSRNSIKEWWNNFKIACSELVDAIFGDESMVEEYDNIDSAVKATSGENLDKVTEALKYENDKLQKQAREMFGDSEKDSDGYNKIPDKVTKFKAEVSEEKAVKETQVRQKGGKEKTRVDEN